MKVGITRFAYPEKRCITTSSEHDYINLRYFNIYEYAKRLPIIKKIAKDFVFYPLFKNRADIYHSFNDICITNKKWVVTFETMVPRFLDLVNSHNQKNPEYKYNEIVNKYLKYISNQNCLGVVAISDCTRKIQEKLLQSFPEVESDINNKTYVIYPPQDVLVTKDNILKKQYDNLKFIFVGNDFYRKGGGEIVLAVQELILENKISENDIQITLVGNIEADNNYALGKFQDDENYRDSIKKIINERKNINLISKIDNKKLLEIIKDHHVGILVTWADTFGYSVLEFQACGCPVISTDVRALPEINNADIGWLIGVRKNDLGEIIIDSFEQKNITRRNIIEKLKEIFLECIENKNIIKEKAIRSLLRIESEHSINDYNRKISEIYSKASS